MPVNLLNEGDLNKYLTSIVFTNNKLISLDGRPEALVKYIFDNNPLQRCGNERE